MSAGTRSYSSGSASMRILLRRRTMSRNRLVVMRCSQPSNVPGAVVRQRPEHADEGLLGEILRVVLISREAIGQAVDAVGVLAHQFVPGRHQQFVAGGVETGGARRDGRHFVDGIVGIGHGGWSVPLS